jgi:predicted GNAT family acetyltransferase
MQMGIELEEMGKKGALFVEKDGERQAELRFFHSAPGRMTIYHTEVNKNLRVTGVGTELVAEAVKYARKKALKIVPTCPFARKVIERTPEFRDVLADE